MFIPDESCVLQGPECMVAFGGSYIPPQTEDDVTKMPVPWMSSTGAGAAGGALGEGVSMQKVGSFWRNSGNSKSPSVGLCS